MRIRSRERMRVDTSRQSCAVKDCFRQSCAAVKDRVTKVECASEEQIRRTAKCDSMQVSLSQCALLLQSQSTRLT